jgi:hypothetical protein
MSEERIRELSKDLAENQITQAKLKRDARAINAAKIVSLDSTIVQLKREINRELLLLSQEQVIELDVETDDTQRNR